MRLANRVAVVTGAASGIGRAIATRFAAEGATVVVSDLHAEPIRDGVNDQPTHEAIRAAGGTATFEQADVSSSEHVNRLITQTVVRFGRLDILVNNAALVEAHNILDTTEEVWDRLMMVNLRGQFLCCRAGIAQMLQQKPINEVRGRIVNIASQHGFVGPPDSFPYAVSKGGMTQMTRQLATDYGPEGILVNAVAPGRIITGTHPGEIDMSDPSLAYSRSRTRYPRLGRPEDVAGAALFLASDDCSYVSGHHLFVDGGWMAY
jgi:NAD(P)-dependent dehydrogenase (short-subunit alcohol dehydrogenase family)